MTTNDNPTPTLAALACTCKRCGASWIPRVDNPKCCPSCKSKLWRTVARVRTAAGETVKP